MQQNNSPIYECANFYMARIAALPFEKINQYIEQLSDQKLLESYQNESLFQEAVFVASSALRKMLENGKTSKEVSQTLLKYLLRSTTRATPFGLFSAIAFCDWSAHVQSNWKPDTLRSYAQIDIAWFYRLTDLLKTDKKFKQHLLFRKNPTLVVSGGRISLQRVITKGKDVRNKEVSIRLTPLLNLILNLTQVPQTFESLCSEMIKVLPQINVDKIREIIDTLIDQDVLTYTLIPSLLTDDIFAHFKYSPLENDFKSLQTDLNRYNNLSPGKGIRLIAEIEEKLSEIAARFNTNENSEDNNQHSLKIDLYQPSTSSFLPRKTTQEIGIAADLIWKFSHVFKGSHDLRTYHEKFVEKYGVSRCVRITEVASADYGIGLPSAYMKEPVPKQISQGWKNWLKKKLFQTLRQTKMEMIISEADFDLLNLRYNTDEAPPSCDLFFELSNDPNQTDQYLITVNTLVQQGMASFGRFYYLLDSQQKEMILQACQREESLAPEISFIETSFLPKDSRGANVAIHQSIRNNILDLVEPENGQYQLNSVYIGATESYLFLADKEGRELLATSGNVLNPTYAPPLLRLIRDISKMRYVNHYPWSWMGFEDAPFLPRVRYKNVILSRAQWIFDLPKNQLKKYQKQNTLFEEFSNWADNWNVPNQFYIGFDDNRILVDRTNLAYKSIILKEIEKHSRILIREQIGSPWIQGPKGKHFSEFVAPVIKIDKYSTFRKRHSAYTPHVDSAFRFQQLGSDWLYFKLYLGLESNTAFILGQLKEFISQIESHDQFKQWYFIRYLDPENHLRVRINGEPVFLLQSVLPLLGNWIRELYAQQHISKCDICVYDREIERYGGPHLIQIAESLFCNDTQVCIALMQIIKQKKSALPEYIIAALSIVDFISRLDLTLEKLIDFFTPAGQSDKNALKNNRSWKKELPLLMEAILKKDSSLAKDIKVLLDVFNLRSETMNQYKTRIKEAKLKGTIPKDYGYVLQSFIHMHLNRLMGYDRDDEIKARAFAYYGLTTLYHLRKANNSKKN